MAKGNYKIPFHKGDMLEYTSAQQGVIPSPTNSWQPTEWRDNVEFDAPVQLTSQSRGRSSARFNVTNLQNKETYSLSLSAAFDAFKHFGVKPGGIIEGRWAFKKQGANYSLVPVLTPVP